MTSRIIRVVHNSYGIKEIYTQRLSNHLGVIWTTGEFKVYCPTGNFVLDGVIGSA